MEKRTKKSVKAEARLPVSEEVRTWMFSGLIRKQDYFERAMGLIQEQHFHSQENWLKMVWSIVLAHHREYGSLPGKQLLLTKCNEAISLDPKALSDGDLTTLDEFIAQTYTHTKKDWPDKPLMAALQQFLEDRLLSGAISALMKPTTPTALGNVFASLAETAQALTILSSSEMREPFGDDGFMNARTGERISTGIDFLDKLLDGGMVAGESYGLLGPTGGGKTTLGVMLTVESAKRAFPKWEAGGRVGPCGRAYHVSYEDSEDALKLRAISYAAEIPRARLEAMIKDRDLSSMSTPDNLQPYEQARYEKNLRLGLDVPCERVRYLKAVEHGVIVPIEVLWLDVVADSDPGANCDHPVIKERHSIWRSAHCNAIIAEAANALTEDQILITVFSIEHGLRLRNRSSRAQI